MTALRDVPPPAPTALPAPAHEPPALAAARYALAAAEAAYQAAGYAVDGARAALRAAQAAGSGAPAVPAVPEVLLLTVDEAARRLSLGETTVRGLLDDHADCKREIGRAVRVHWTSMVDLMARQRKFRGDESRPFPRDMAARRKRAATTTTDTASGGAG